MLLSYCKKNKKSSNIGIQIQQTVASHPIKTITAHTSASYTTRNFAMSPEDINQASTPSVKGHKKRPSDELSGLPQIEPGNQSKKPRVMPDDTPPTTSTSNAIIADNKPQSVSNENGLPPDVLKTSDVSLQLPIRDLSEPTLSNDDPPPPRLTRLGPHEESTQPPPSPRPRHVDLEDHTDSPTSPCAPTDNHPPIDIADQPMPDAPDPELPTLDEDLLATQIEEFCRPERGEEEEEEDSRLVEARWNVETANTLHKSADRAMETAREKNISKAGNEHMENIVRRALARLRAAKHRQKKTEAHVLEENKLKHESRAQNPHTTRETTPGPSAANSRGSNNEGIPISRSSRPGANPRPVITGDERDQEGNTWCLGMTGTSFKNQCCSDCKI